MLFDLFKIEVVSLIPLLGGLFLRRRGRLVLLLLLLILITQMLLHIPHLAAHMLRRIINGNDEIKHQFVKYPAYEDVEK